MEELIQNIKNFLEYLISLELQEKVFSLEIIFIVVSILFLLGIIYFLLRTDYLKYTSIGNFEILSEFKDYGRRKIVKKWNKIKKRLEKDIEAQWKIGVIEADEMLDKILARIGYGGKNLDERLRKLKEGELSNLEQVKAGHRVCGDIARDPEYRLSREKAGEIINTFEKALRELQAL